MANTPSPAQIEWHMHLLRQWQSPKQPSTSRDTQQDYTFSPQDFQMPSIPAYSQQVYDTCSIQSEPMLSPQLSRAQTLPYFPDYAYGARTYLAPIPLTLLDCSGGDVTGFDDVMSCSAYSDAPSSSYLSCDFSEQSTNFDELAPTSTPSSYCKGSLLEPPRASCKPDTQPASEVDALMLALQPTDTNSSATSSSAQSHPQPSKPKKHPCPHLSCTKSFTQLTHLKIHHRSHTGEKPYTCSIPSCAQSFSQLGNLRTHERRHAGQKPVRNRGDRERALSCSGGGGGVKYVCRLDPCRGKLFTQLGNLKSHQNKFHAETLRVLSLRLVGEDESQEQRELREYFCDLYRNSNKGIKGRGKGRRVEVVAPL